MSGTSIDGVDYALCRISPRRIQLADSWQVKFPPLLKRQIHLAARGEANSHEVGQLHHDLGRFLALHASRRARPELVGMHGQTIFHRSDKQAPATLQIGEPAYLAESLRVPVISNFRAADIAAGGEGAPLATLFHERVFGRARRHVCVQNIGGIGNVTSLNYRKEPRRILSFDTGPGNLLIDLAITGFTNGKMRFDRDGCYARRGAVHESLLNTWLRAPFFTQAPPKSTGREQFGESFLQKTKQHCHRLGLSKNDVLATLTAFTAQSIALNYRLHLGTPPDEVIVAGGGARNLLLRAWLAREFSAWDRGIKVKATTDFGWAEQSIEPSAFALLAYHRWHKLPGNVPGTTGARRPVLLGQITEC